MSRWVACLLALCLALSAFAQTPPPQKKVEDMSLDELMSTFVTLASKLSQLVSDAPASITVIPDYQLQGFGWNSLNAVLYAQPGFAPSMDYDRRTVSSRGVFEGWNNNHLLLLIDGVPVNDNLYGSAYTSEITPLFMAKSVEVLRGPGSALYGSNAMNGAVSITTIKPEDIGRTVTGTLRYGNFGTRNVDVIGGASSELVSFVAGYSGYETKGNEYESLDGSRRTDSAGNLLAFRTHDRRRNDYVLMKLDGRGALDGLSLQMHWQGWNFGTGQGWIFYIPDFKEAMHETRQIASLAYHHTDARKWQHEYVVRYQRHSISWNQRYYPNDATDPYGDFYPAGLWEFLDTSANDVFGRAQVSIPMNNNASIVTGVETDRFDYRGDNEHFSNVNINYGGDYQPFDQNRMQPLGPWLAWVKGNPVYNLGAYAQYSSGTKLGDKVAVTAGLRYDRQSFKLNALDLAGTPKENKSFAQTSPRIGVIFKPDSKVTMKALIGRAFRAPAPTEMFGANTYSLASNPRQLQPENVTSLEFITEWRATNDLLLRANAYRNNFKNEIAYSVANANLSTNVFSLKTAGLELESLFGTPQDYAFANVSFARRLDETIIDPTIAVSRHEMTWYPEHIANAGYMHDARKWQASVSAHYQGEVNRRESDRIDAQFLPHRGNSVGSWLSLDGVFNYRIGEKLELGVQGTNLLGKNDRTLVKTNDFPFDYRMQGRRILLRAGVKL